MLEVEAPDAVMTCIILVFHWHTLILFDVWHIFLYVCANYALGNNIVYESHDVPIYIFALVCDLIVVDRVP